MSKNESFYELTPDAVMNAIEDAGYQPTGEFQQLNSYENRVFDVRLEKTSSEASTATTEAGEPTEITRVVGKFYRPSRWSREAIQNEHDFLIELKDEGVAAIAPLKFPDGTTIREIDGMYFTLFPRFAGRMPQEFLPGDLKKVGRTLARIHNIGSQRPADHRPQLHPSAFSWDYLDILQDWIDPAVWPRYEKAATTILEFLEDELDESSFIRIHGDCHRGNLLDNGEEFFFVDFDDFVNGPVAQDFWMILSGQEQELQDEIIAGYEELREFPDEQLDLFEPLRGLRIVNYAGWIANRWEDPSFPKLFPDFGSYHYSAEEVENLEKIAWQL